MTEPHKFDLSPNTPWGRSVTAAEFSQMCQTGRLEGALLERYWRMNDFQGPMPAAIEIMVRKSDVERVVRELKRERKGRRR
jgi:hypothetical protein